MASASSSPPPRRPFRDSAPSLTGTPRSQARSRDLSPPPPARRSPSPRPEKPKAQPPPQPAPKPLPDLAAVPQEALAMELRRRGTYPLGGPAGRLFPGIQRPSHGPSVGSYWLRADTASLISGLSSSKWGASTVKRRKTALWGEPSDKVRSLLHAALGPDRPPAKRRRKAHPSRAPTSSAKPPPRAPLAARPVNSPVPDPRSPPPKSPLPISPVVLTPPAPRAPSPAPPPAWAGAEADSGRPEANPRPAAPVGAVTSDADAVARLEHFYSMVKAQPKKGPADIWEKYNASPGVLFSRMEEKYGPTHPAAVDSLDWLMEIQRGDDRRFDKLRAFHVKCSRDRDRAELREEVVAHRFATHQELMEWRRKLETLSARLPESLEADAVRDLDFLPRPLPQRTAPPEPSEDAPRDLEQVRAVVRDFVATSRSETVKLRALRQLISDRVGWVPEKGVLHEVFEEAVASCQPPAADPPLEHEAAPPAPPEPEPRRGAGGGSANVRRLTKPPKRGKSSAAAAAARGAVRKQVKASAGRRRPTTPKARAGRSSDGAGCVVASPSPGRCARVGFDLVREWLHRLRPPRPQGRTFGDLTPPKEVHPYSPAWSALDPPTSSSDGEAPRPRKASNKRRRPPPARGKGWQALHCKEQLRRLHEVNGDVWYRWRHPVYVREGGAQVRRSPRRRSSVCREVSGGELIIVIVGDKRAVRTRQEAEWLPVHGGGYMRRSEASQLDTDETTESDS
eukprot:TRINITY_DN9482_c1_g1_i1.p1 TRINITY_DN9482_c1_g1~~TRINITY_DN9482_c1_g1_i1.p1  ORF type:complete len:763 (+),score=215.29 TRINITY_DN9482_c1_g1_i1:83-2290(+)